MTVLARQDVAVGQELLERLSDARERSDALFRVLRDDAIYDRPISERHRIIFYVGHLDTFDWNLLRGRALKAQSFNPEFDRLFAFGIDPTDGGLPSDQPADWPRLESVQQYAQGIRKILDGELASLAGSPSDANSLDLLLNVAIEHRLMHVETLAYMLHQLPYEKKTGSALTPKLVTSPAAPRMLEIPSGAVTLGRPRGSSFGWDNEYGNYSVNLPAFEIDQFMVTNRQFLDFVNAGGYETRSFWNDADWGWKAAEEISHPVFWKKSGDGWRYRGMFEEFPLPLEWPVYVSHAEATAFARWAGKALPSEEQWQRAAYGASDAVARPYPWGVQSPTADLCNANFASWDPSPVNALPNGQSEFGVQGMLGNGWEWTSTPFAPFQGFERYEFYRGYSADFFDGKHFVMKGGSPRTAACMLRSTFRNWFQPHYQYVYAGFRCVNR
jgi:ergothioneine biosynthesis protein EgtB